MSTLTNFNDLKTLIEPEIFDQINDDSKLIEDSKVTVDTEHHITLSHNRFDVAFKLLFLQGLDQAECATFRELCYKQHIKAFSEGTFSEPNNPEKSTYESFKKVFEQLFTTLKTESFDSNKSLIPLACDGSILNGAHRSSATVFFNKPAGVVKTQLPPRNFDYLFFKERGVPTAMLDAAAQTFIEYDDKCFLAAVWPAAKGHEVEIDNILSNVVYKKKVKLTYNGAHNLLAEAYKDELWLGPRSKNLPGIKNKLVGCFPNFDPVRVYIFKAKNLEEVLVLKDKIRDLFKIEKHAIHITDNQEETLRLGRLLLNDNGVNFLNSAQPRAFTEIKFNELSQLLSEKKINKNEVMFDENVLLSLYGMRENTFSIEKSLHCCNAAYIENTITKNTSTDNTGIDNTSTENKITNNKTTDIQYYEEPLVELIDDPKYHFWYKGFKCISLQQVYLMKQKRLTQQDVYDIKFIKSMIKSSKIKDSLDVLRSSLYFKKIKLIAKCRLLITTVLNKLGLLFLLKKILNKH